MPVGTEKRAALPVPSTDPVDPACPASVVTTPAGVIIRTVLLLPTCTYRLSAASIATAFGELNRAAAPVPYVLPEFSAKPANVVTVPSGVTLRIVWLLRSATKTLRCESSATPNGYANRAVD